MTGRGMKKGGFVNGIHQLIYPYERPRTHDMEVNGYGVGDGKMGGGEDS